MAKAWSKDEVKLLKKLFPNRDRQETADRLGRSLPSVNNKAQRLGIKTKRPPRWSKDKDKLLKKLYPNISTNIIAEQFGRSAQSIRQRAYRIELKKTKKYLKSLGRG